MQLGAQVKVLILEAGDQVGPVAAEDDVLDASAGIPTVRAGRAGIVERDWRRAGVDETGLD